MDKTDFENEVLDLFKEQFQVKVSKFTIEKEFEEAGIKQLIGKAETSVQNCWVIGNDEGITVYSEVSYYVSARFMFRRSLLQKDSKAFTKMEQNRSFIKKHLTF